MDLGADFHQPLRWPGHYFDAELGLHYNRFRTYSPETGRYLEPDPFGRGGGLENVYQYSVNPLRVVDLRGLNSSCPIGPRRPGTVELGEGKPDEESAGTEGDAQSELDGRIDASRDAAERAADARADRNPRKCYAADGPEADLTQSGWGHSEGDGIALVSTDAVAARCDEIGHALKPSGASDNGEPGRYNASHAEKQQAIARPNEPVGVSNPMCSDCKNFFSKLAQSTGRQQVVTDPDVTRVFNPDGTVAVRYPNGTIENDPRFPSK